MSAEQLVLQGLNGLAIAALLFILAAGLSLIFGLMDFVNLAHGAFYAIGGYLAYSLVRGSASACLQASLDFWVALVVVPLVLGLIGLLLHITLLRRLGGRHLEQVLLTIGVSIVAADAVRWCWGGEVLSLPAPRGLDASVPVLGQDYPVYRLFLVAFGAALAAALWLLQERTRLGALIRAAVSDSAMLAALGVDTERLFAFTFAAGAALAGLAGVVGTPIIGLDPLVPEEVLILSLVVVVIGGLGRLSGAVLGALVVGPARTFGNLLLPEFSLAFIFMVMAGVLLLRPTGLFGRR